MSDVYKIFLVFVGGGIGSAIRYLLAGFISQRTSSFFPWGTLTINVTGSLLIGLFMGLSLRETWNPGTRIFIAIGVLGGYTTFSTFSYETINLIADKLYYSAAFNIFGNVCLSVVACWSGLVLARGLAGG
jgi:CrcB protein